METLLIVLALVAIGVAIAVWIARRPPPAKPPERQMDQDTAWNDPVTPAEQPSDEIPKS